MKKIINDPADVVAEALAGMALAHPDLLEVHRDPDFITRRAGTLSGKVAVLSGGGSGHEPLHGGFVGHGMLSAAATQEGEFALMAPMVTYADEVRAFRDLVDAAAAGLAAEQVRHRRPDALGVMVEVPAAALAVDEIATDLDFVSVGTNDLLQYLAAAERTLPEVAGLYRPYSTAVWRILELIVAGARRAGARVSVCGEIAEDPAAAQRLVQLGVQELSVLPTSVARVKAALRSWAGTPHAERLSGEDAAPAG